MVINCSNCDARLHVDEAKAPSPPFNVRCPKCQATVSVPPQSPVKDEPASAPPPPSEPMPAAPPPSSFQRPSAAPVFKSPPDETTYPNEPTAVGLNDIAKLLTEALDQSGQAGRGRRRPGWDKRKALVCATPAYRDVVAHALSNYDYTVFVAENTLEALGRMREDRMDVIVLDANFDPLEQGVAFITREVRLLRPSERRRVFLVYLTTGVRTMDLHAAFLQNVNLVVNPSDVEYLTEALDISLRHYNQLYQNFNHALGGTPI